MLDLLPIQAILKGKLASSFSSAMSLSLPLSPNWILEKRYRIVRLLGEGGFGRAYLAEHLNRFNEYCVLKEFAPQVSGEAALRKARELFQREAGVLYQLRHPQIPEFLELLQVSWQGHDRLFLVQQFIDGPTYWSLANRQPMSEAEVVQLLRDVLPVLSYIHNLGVVHRDISPDNLIRTTKTGKPVLIDFGGVKQVAATAIQQLAGQPTPTQLCKAGYTPEEQLRGQPLPASDLYALGATALALLTGRYPTEFYDSYNRQWQWQRYVQLSPALESVIQRMVADRLSDRYPTAEAALSDLEARLALASASYSQGLPYSLPSQYSQHPQAQKSQLETRVVAPGRPQNASRVTQTSAGLRPGDNPRSRDWPLVLWMVVRNLGWAIGWTVVSLVKAIAWSLRMAVDLLSLLVKTVNALVALGVIGAIVALVLLFRGGIPGLQLPAPEIKIPAPEIKLPDWKVSRPDWLQWPTDSRQPNSGSSADCQAALARSQALAVPRQTLVSQVNDRFYARNPQLNGRALTQGPEDNQLRQQWCQIAQDVMDEIERSR